jgi:hypothetical protein
MGKATGWNRVKDSAKAGMALVFSSGNLSLFSLLSLPPSLPFILLGNKKFAWGKP